MQLDRPPFVHGNLLAVASELIRKQVRARAMSTYSPIPPAVLVDQAFAQTKPKAKPRAVDIVCGERLLCIKEVCHKVSMGKSTVYRWINEGRFPHGIELAPQLFAGAKA